MNESDGFTIERNNASNYRFALELEALPRNAPAVRITGHWWYADIFIGPVPMLKTLAFTSLAALAVALFR